MNPQLEITAAPARGAARHKACASRGVRYLFGRIRRPATVCRRSKCVPVDYLESMSEGSELYTVGAPRGGMGELGPNEDEVAGHNPISVRWRCCRGTSASPVAPADLRFHGHALHARLTRRC